MAVVVALIVALVVVLKGVVVVVFDYSYFYCCFRRYVDESGGLLRRIFTGGKFQTIFNYDQVAQ